MTSRCHFEKKSLFEKCHLSKKPLFEKTWPENFFFVERESEKDRTRTGGQQDREIFESPADAVPPRRVEGRGKRVYIRTNHFLICACAKLRERVTPPRKVYMRGNFSNVVVVIEPAHYIWREKAGFSLVFSGRNLSKMFFLCLTHSEHGKIFSINSGQDAGGPHSFFDSWRIKSK